MLSLKDTKQYRGVKLPLWLRFADEKRLLTAVVPESGRLGNDEVQRAKGNEHNTRDGIAHYCRVLVGSMYVWVVEMAHFKATGTDKSWSSIAR